MNRTIGTCLKTAGLTALLSVYFSVAALAAQEDPNRFPGGTEVNGVVIGGLTVDEARAQIQNSYAAEYKLTIREKGGKKEEITGAEIGFAAVVPAGLQEILNGQNDTGRQSGPSAGNSYTLPVQTSYDEAALNARIQSLSCISGADIVVTADARVSDYQEGQPFTIVPEVVGNNVDPEITAAVIRAAAAAGNEEVDLAASGCYKTVQVTKEDARLQALCDAMNRCRDMSITYTVGETSVVLPGSMIASWLKGSPDGQIAVDPETAAAYVAALAAQFDTAGTARTFHTAGGRDVTLTGPYGWRLNQEAETAALIAMIQTAQTQTREPEFAQSAASHTGPEWGNTYVEVDLTGQHVYMMQDGVLVWDAPCVTGNVSKNYTTPEGIYSLAYKQTDRILRGAKKADGTYEYESHVNYWMPFNGGIGLHDADWRSKFGGTIYQYGGSHGCINLPPSKAKALYDLIYTGIPVLCYN